MNFWWVLKWLKKPISHKAKNAIGKNFTKAWRHLEKQGCAGTKIIIYIKNYGESEKKYFENVTKNLSTAAAAERRRKSVEIFMWEQEQWD